jgi:hypothetical protein
MYTTVIDRDTLHHRSSWTGEDEGTERMNVRAGEFLFLV